MKKIIGLSCGRKNGNCETLVKEAAMGAEEMGVATEIIRATSLRVLPCQACGACRETNKCVLKDDVDWILEKTCVEDCGLIVSVPCYHIRSSASLMCINERMNHFISGNNDVLKKTRVGAIIGVGGLGHDGWTSLVLPTANIFVQHIRLLVDQVQVNYAAEKGAVLTDAHKKDLERVRQLGRNVARAMMMPIEEVKFMGDEPVISCPVCHCNILLVTEDLPHVACPVCWVRGVISADGGKMKVEWNEEDIRHPRFSHEMVSNNLKGILEHAQKEGLALAQNEVKERIKKYSSYGKIIKPEKVSEKYHA